MSAIRFGQDGYKVYIYFDKVNKGLNISAPSFTAVVKDMRIAKAVVDVLVEKQEVPSDMWKRIEDELWDITMANLGD